MRRPLTSCGMMRNQCPCSPGAHGSTPVACVRPARSGALMTSSASPRMSTLPPLRLIGPGLPTPRIGMALFVLWPFTRLVHAFTCRCSTSSGPTSLPLPRDAHACPQTATRLGARRPGHGETPMIDGCHDGRRGARDPAERARPRAAPRRGRTAAHGRRTGRPHVRTSRCTGAARGAWPGEPSAPVPISSGLASAARTTASAES